MEDLQYLDYVNDSSDSSDEDLINVGAPRTRNEDYLEQTVIQYTEKEFFENFRVSRNVATQICQMYEESGFYNNLMGQYGRISAYNQVLIFLWYIGHHSAGFTDVSDRFNISLSSLERIIKKLTVFLSNLSPQVITWPNNEEKQAIELEFRASGFPNVIGAIDGCHVKIDKPENDPDSYINRKGYYSVQMQIVCDKQRKIRDIFVGWPGSVHDSRVFRNSPLCRLLPEKCGNYFLLGDSGYPLQLNLLTPFKDRGQLTERQIYYNVQLAKNRYVIEHCFGIVKQKFRQLYHIKLRNMEYIVHLMRAACILHNIALSDELELDEAQLNHDLPPPIDNEDENDEENINMDIAPQNVRNAVVNELFDRL